MSSVSTISSFTTESRPKMQVAFNSKGAAVATPSNGNDKNATTAAEPSKGSTGDDKGSTGDDKGRSVASTSGSNRSSVLSRRLASLETEISKEHEAHEQTRQELLRTAKEVELLRAVLEGRLQQKQQQQQPEHTSATKVPPTEVMSQQQNTQSAAVHRPGSVASTIPSTSSLYAS